MFSKIALHIKIKDLHLIHSYRMPCGCSISSHTNIKARKDVVKF